MLFEFKAIDLDCESQELCNTATVVLTIIGINDIPVITQEEINLFDEIDNGNPSVTIDGDIITIQSRRGKIDVYARRDDGLQLGQVFVPFCYVEAAANVLTNAALDPDAKIPEFKFCAVKIKTKTIH